jgi:hypothetical protein
MVESVRDYSIAYLVVGVVGAVVMIVFFKKRSDEGGEEKGGEGDKESCAGFIKNWCRRKPMKNEPTGDFKKNQSKFEAVAKSEQKTAVKPNRANGAKYVQGASV